jgi:ketosteroid isomerase-like protein
VADTAGVDRWVERYVHAWASNDAADIEALFTEDARYFTAPYRAPYSGHDEIVRWWLERAQEPGTWTFRHEVLAVQGDLAFVQGWTTEQGDDDAWNLWIVRFDEEGRASEFVEWWMVPE